MTRRDGYERLLWYVESSKLLVALCHFDEFWGALLAQYACGHSMTAKPISVGTHSWGAFLISGRIGAPLAFLRPSTCLFLCIFVCVGRNRRTSGPCRTWRADAPLRTRITSPAVGTPCFCLPEGAAGLLLGAPTGSQVTQPPPREGTCPAAFVQGLTLTWSRPGWRTVLRTSRHLIHAATSLASASRS